MKLEQCVVFSPCFLIKEEVSMGDTKHLFWLQQADNYLQITVQHRSAQTKCRLEHREVSSLNEARDLLRSSQYRTN